MKRGLKLKFYIFELATIALFGLIPLLWYGQGYIALGHDMSFPLAPVDFFLDRLYVWTDRMGSFGSNQTDAISGIFIHGLEAFFSTLGFSLINTQKLTFIFWFTLPGITMYILLHSIHPEKDNYIIRVSGSLFYMMNHYLLQGWVIAERTKFSVVAALPLIVLIIINVVIREKSILGQSILLSFILFFLNGGAGIPLWGGILIVGLCTTIIALIYSSEKWVKKLARTSIFIFISAIFILLLNFYWIYPYVASFNQNFTQRLDLAGGVEAAISWSRDISRNTSLSNLFRMQGIPDWYDNSTHPYSNQFLNNPALIVLSLIFPSLAFLGLLKKEEEKREESMYKIVFLFILIVGLLFAAGSHPPFGGLYDFLLKEVPGFSIFRTPFYKFGMVLWLAYAYLIALGLKWVVETLLVRIKYFRGKLTALLLGLFIVILSIYNYPFFTGSFFFFSKEFSTMVKIPNYIFDVKKELEDDNFSGRTLLVPNTDKGTKLITYTWKYFSLSSIPSILSRESVLINDVILREVEPDIINAIFSELNRNTRSNLLRFTGVDRAIVQNDFTSPETMDYSVKSTNNDVKKSAQFKLSKKVGKWDFYNVLEESTAQEILPLIYSPVNIAYVSSSVNNLSFSAEIPAAPLSSDSFVFFKRGGLSTDVTSINNFNLYILEGVCVDCPQEINLTIDATPPAVLPNSSLYFLSEYFENRDRDKLVAQPKLIDFILKNMSKRVGSLGIFIGKKENEKVINKLIKALNEDVLEISKNYILLDDDLMKNKYSQIIYRHFQYFNSNLEQWRLVAANEKIKNDLNLFEKNLKDYINDVKLIPLYIKDPDNIVSHQYSFIVPQKGQYKISVYNPLNPKDTFYILLNNKRINLKRVEISNWYQSEVVEFDEGIHLAEIPRFDFSNYLVTLADFIIKKEGIKKICKEINITTKILDNTMTYKIEFKQRSVDDSLFEFKIVEQNRMVLDDQERIVYPTTIQETDDKFYKTTIMYKPSQLAKNAILKMCLNSDPSEPSVVNVYNFQVLPVNQDNIIFASYLNQTTNFKPPKVEYVKLNQTKYLVRVKNAPKEFTIQLNLRFDKAWKLREVETSLADVYFIKAKKEYLNGNVVEYSGFDKHILTDWVFKNSRYEKNSEITLNGFANGWSLKSGKDSKNEKVYLIEYTLQNDLYKSVLVTGISLVFGSLLYAKYKH